MDVVETVGKKTAISARLDYCTRSLPKHQLLKRDTSTPCIDLTPRSGPPSTWFGGPARATRFILGPRLQTVVWGPSACVSFRRQPERPCFLWPNDSRLTQAMRQRKL